jgi:Protein of unknown function (DUF2971)
MNIMKKKIPDRFFKYMSINAYTVQALATRHLFFCALERLNDPFEGRIIFDMSRENLEKLINSGKDGPIISVEDAKIFLNLPKFDSDRKALNHRLAKRIRSEIAVCCFSKDGSNQLMFAHYGAMTGICLEFDTSSQKVFLDLVPVNYEQIREKISFAFLSKKQQEVIGRQKDKIWEYEHEWRLMRMGEKEVPFDFRSLKSVTFGPYAKMADKATIMRLLRGLKVEFFDCTVSQGKNWKLGRKKVHLPKKFLRDQ